MESRSDQQIKQARVEDCLHYNECRFFHLSARRAVYGDQNNDTVHNYHVKRELMEGAGYVITARKQEIYMQIQDICLKVYNTGVAIFVMDCINTGYDRAGAHCQNSVSIVKMINEYGRRIAIPYFTPEVSRMKCADQLRIELDHGKLVLHEDFEKFVEEFHEKEQTEIVITYIMDIIKKLLQFFTDQVVFSSRRSDEEDKLQIVPAIDSKMYVSCMIRDPIFYAQLLKEWNQEDSAFHEQELEKSVYELIYADLEEECSCLNPAERRKQIRESLYLTNFPAQNRINEPQGGQPDRTKTVPDQNTGELTAITAHTYLCMTAGNQQFTLDNHNTVLKQLILLVLAQRASIIAFQNVMSKISCGLEIHQQIMNNRKVSELMNLQERFVVFQNQLILFEVTPQREGSAIYRCLQKRLYIEEENRKLRERLSGLAEMANINQGYLFNKGGLILAVFALIGATFGSIGDLTLVPDGFVGLNGQAFALLLIECILCVVAAFIILKRIFRK